MTLRLGKRAPRSDTCLGLLLLAALACTEGDTPLATRSYIDEGDLCLSPRGAGGAHVQVLFDTCASSCHDVAAASCAASITEDGVIRVESEARTQSTGAEICDTGCRQVDAACTLPELPDGNYELRYGARTATISLPVAIAGSLVTFDAEPAPNDDPCELLPLLP